MRFTAPLRRTLIQRHIEEINQYTAKAFSIGGLYAPFPDVNMVDFARYPEEHKSMKVMSDGDHRGYSRAQMETVPFKPDEIPEEYKSGDPNAPPPMYAKFSGVIDINIPPGVPGIFRSGYTGWRTPDPKWTLFGKTYFNCEALAFLGLRFKADHRSYYVNIQCDSHVPTDLWQHRLFARTPGEWETVYIPFQDFVKTTEGNVFEKQGYWPRHKIQSVGMSLIDGIPGPFEMCIDKIWASDRREMDEDSPLV
ncbi:CIA30-domain-containing protein [Ascodesmis nigricans]|uniref:CIA30-domain-containing protein n=1 Tax=Ascodesmis nigricans TaxID=341454 RepID=A0A4S2N570_9PEZI|nr:CIA30-domain-containing protein [Ascodesmis nigricans]